MTIYILDSNKKKCAQYLDDKALETMMRDIALVLEDSRKLHNFSIGDLGKWVEWISKGNSNYRFMCVLGYTDELIKELIHRNLDTKANKKYMEKIYFQSMNYPSFPKQLMTDEFPLIMPKKYQNYNPDHVDNIILSYRNFYCSKIRQKPLCFLNWTDREPPEWVIL